MGWLLIKIVLLAFLDRKEARNLKGHSKDREELEKEIMDVWAEKYVQRFFAPFAVSKAPVTLDQIVVQLQNTTNEKRNKLYKVATKFDFYNSNIMSEKNINAFNFETSFKNLDGRKVSSKLQKYYLKHFLSATREDEDSLYYRETASFLVTKLGRMGLYVLTHNFAFSQEDSVTRAGVNIVGILPGARWGTPEDKIMMVTAHWDTVASSPGLDDNGSGVAALLETARILTNRGQEDVILNTVIFAFLDKEEVGCEGAKALIRDFVVPVLVKQFGAVIQGVYNLDSLFEFSREAESQTVEESWSEMDSGLVHRIVTNRARGDFLLTIGRNMETDTNLALTLAKHLRTNTAHHLKVNDFFEKLPDKKTLERRIFPLRSDIARFWFYKEELQKDVFSQFSFPGVTVTDTSYLRARMRVCYHSACDSLHGITEENISFLRNVTQAVTEAVMELATEDMVDFDSVGEDVEVVIKEVDESVQVMEGKQENEKTAERISHYDKVETQINIENLYLTLDQTHERLKEDDYFYVNPQLNRINNIMKSFFKSTNGTSPTIFKLSKTDL